MTENTGKFTGRADNYARYRPTYPLGVTEYLRRNVRADKVADIGAGTGIFTGLLAQYPWKVYAVEPNDDMRQVLTRDLGGKVNVVAAPAENTTLPSNTFGLVTVAQAFHWFDPTLFKAECKRIMKQGGRLAIIWNGITDSKFGNERNDVCREMCENFSWGHAGRFSEYEGDEFLRKEFFADMEYTSYDNTMSYTLDSFLGDNLSRSYAPKSSDLSYIEFIERLTAVFEKYERNGRAEMPYKTTCYFGRL